MHEHWPGRYMHTLHRRTGTPSLREIERGERGDTRTGQAHAPPQQLYSLATTRTRNMDDLMSWTHNALQEGGRVFVHCQSGISRSATVVLCYLVRYHCMDFEQAYVSLKAKRPIIKPNPAFKQIVVQYAAVQLGLRKQDKVSDSLIEEKGQSCIPY
jgi:hypothetical protein